ncbi:MAG TPA: aminotransferase class V-fold PLP-dependent enzyme [Candidatus Limnocylindrales bacterium]|nr:aminotransferase class V-fold PLP-dependent enzyme [Candidatus Limnocylindrales bacterium]
MDTRRDAATTDSLGAAIRAVLPSLERFVEFEGQDPARHRSRWRPALERRLPATGIGRDATLAELADLIVTNGLRVGHPGFSGWVTTGPSDVAAAADLAQAVAVPQRWWTTAGNFVDHLAMRWLIELLGFPAASVGTFTSGGSTANLVGIGAARQHAGERLGLRPSLDGIAGMVEPRVYASTETHHVVGRALGVLGMGRRNLRSIPLDRAGTIDLDLLQAALDEDGAAGRTQVAVVGCAGDVNGGRVDPLAELARIAHERGIWLHVDGAYGGFGLLDERVRERYGDVATYDSFAIDPHKWMAAPVGTGAAIVRDEGILGRAFTIETGDYDSERQVASSAGDADLGSPFDELGLGTPDWGVDFSTPARGLAVWAILREIGADGLRERIVRHDDCARHVAARAVAAPELELLAEPVLSICCFRFRPAGWTDEARIDALNEAIVHGTRARGRVVTSSTRVDGRLAIRPCFINPRSTLADADALVEEVLTVGRELAVSGS